MGSTKVAPRLSCESSEVLASSLGLFSQETVPGARIGVSSVLCMQTDPRRGVFREFQKDSPRHTESTAQSKVHLINGILKHYATIRRCRVEMCARAWGPWYISV